MCTLHGYETQYNGITVVCVGIGGLIYCAAGGSKPQTSEQVFPQAWLTPVSPLAQC